MSCSRNTKSLRLCDVGDSGVGKSNLYLRFKDDVFHDGFITTVGGGFVSLSWRLFDHPCVRNGERFASRTKLSSSPLFADCVCLVCFTVVQTDTQGQERFRSLTSAFYKGVDGVVLCFDLTDEVSLLVFTPLDCFVQKSLQNIDYWWQDFERYGPEDAVRWLTQFAADFCVCSAKFWLV